MKSKSSKGSKRGNPSGGSHPMEEIADDVSSIHGEGAEYRAEGVAEGRSQRTQGRSGAGSRGKAGEASGRAGGPTGGHWAALFGCTVAG